MNWIEKQIQRICDKCNAAGQLLAYDFLLKANNINVKQTILLSTKYDDIVPNIIKEYNLPIKLVLFSKKYTLISQ